MMRQGQEDLDGKVVEGQRLFVTKLERQQVNKHRQGFLVKDGNVIGCYTVRRDRASFAVYLLEPAAGKHPDQKAFFKGGAAEWSQGHLATTAASLRQARAYGWRILEVLARICKRDDNPHLVPTKEQRLEAARVAMEKFGLKEQRSPNLTWHDLPKQEEPKQEEPKQEQPKQEQPKQEQPSQQQRDAEIECQERLEIIKLKTPTLASFLKAAMDAHDQAKSVVNPRHEAYEELRQRVELGGIRNYLLVGPAGSGKTSIAANLAEDLGLQFGMLSLTAGVTESQLLGRILPPKYELVPSPFVKIYSEGGVFLLDELDAAEPNVLLAVNSALANGMLVTPDGQSWKRHDDCYILAAANTWGKGAERGYSGRNSLDRSTRDRFTLKSLHVDYSPVLEAAIARKTCKEMGDRLAILSLAMALRKIAMEQRIEETISARFVAEGCKLMDGGATLASCLEWLLVSWSPNDREKVSAIAKEIGTFTKACRDLANRLQFA